MPSFQTILVFNFGAKALLRSKNNTEIEMEKCLVLGPVKRAFDYSLLPGCGILVANFKDDAFYRFFKRASVAGQSASHPDELLGANCFTDLWEDLNQIDTIQDRVNYILEFCKPYLLERKMIAEKLTNFHDKAFNPIKYLAAQQEQSIRNIQLIHKKYLGYTSKEIIRYQRFLKAIAFVQNIATVNSKIDWFEIIAQCGYYDQSQLIHDFNFYIHMSPTKYLKFQKDICFANAK